MSLLARASKSMMPRTTVARRFVATDYARDKAATKKVWFGDVSTYPILTVITAAVVGAGGYCVYKFTSCPDVRVTGNAKKSVLRTWG